MAKRRSQKGLEFRRRHLAAAHLANARPKRQSHALRSGRTKKQPLSAVQAAGTASDPLFIAVVNQWGDAALLRKAKQDAADMTDKTHTILIAEVSDVGADARSSSFYLRTISRHDDSDAPIAAEVHSFLR
jgi:hypothetical protein